MLINRIVLLARLYPNIEFKTPSFWNVVRFGLIYAY